MAVSMSVHAAATVHDDRLPGDESAVVRGEKDDGTHEVRRHFRALDHPHPDIRFLTLPGDILFVLAAEGEAGGDRVDANAGVPELARQRAREADHAALRRRGMDEIRHAPEERAGGD